MELSENELWWSGRKKPVMTKAEFDAKSNLELNAFAAVNLCRFYMKWEAQEVWLQWPSGLLTDFTIDDEGDRIDGRRRFNPCGDEMVSLTALARKYGIKKHTGSGRGMIWRIMLAEGMTPGFSWAVKLV